MYGLNRGSRLFVFLLLISTLNPFKAFASTADVSATADWTTFDISMTAVSGVPALTLITGTYAHHDYSMADEGSISQTDDVYDWTTGTTATVTDGASYATSSTVPSALSSSIHIDQNGQLQSQSVRYGYVAVTGGTADVTFSVDTHLSDSIPPNATSYTAFVDSELYVGPSGSTSTADDSSIFRYWGDGLPLAPESVDKTLNVTVRLIDNQAASYSISTNAQLTLYSPAPVPLPAGAWLFGSGAIALLLGRRRQRTHRTVENR